MNPNSDLKGHMDRAVKHFGTQGALVAALRDAGHKVSRQAITKACSDKEWGSASINPVTARYIEQVTGGVVTRHQLCPDVFGEAEMKEDAA